MEAGFVECAFSKRVVAISLDAGPLIVGNDRLAEPQAVYALGVLFCGNVEDLGTRIQGSQRHE